MWKFCGKAQFPQSFGRNARNYAENVFFHKISNPGNLGEITVIFEVNVSYRCLTESELHLCGSLYGISRFCFYIPEFYRRIVFCVKDNLKTT